VKSLFIVIFKVSVEAEVPLFFNLVYTADDTRVGISLTSFCKVCQQG